ncbi:MAG: PIN domain-containing protein [Hormoscilla sp. SP12CHS1]|nr:PIN domain-containing protein [Hormoscilla sp. SP12CHS1]
MTNQVYRINDYQFSATNSVLFDANVWLYIYGPTGNRDQRLQSTYTLALRRIRSVRGRIFLDVLVLSEFINAFIYNELPQVRKPANFKTFRDSDRFKPVAAKIARKADKILDKCELTESGLTSVNLRGMVREYAAGEYDFNDQMLAELCKAKELILVTHDTDFSGDNLTILTANRRLLPA